MGDLWDVGRKELEDSFSSRRFLIVLGLFLVLSLASVYIGIDNYQTQIDNFGEGSSIYGQQPEMPSLIEIFEPLLRFNLALTAGLLGLFLSYNFISKEREAGTMELLLSYPVYRDEIINGKLVAGVFTVALTLLISFLVSSGLAIFMLDKIPSIEVVSRLSFIWLGTTLYITFFLSLGTLLSTVFRSQWRSLMIGVLLLIAFIGTPFIAGIAAPFIYPHEEPASEGAAVEGRPEVDMGEKDRPQREIVEEKRQWFISVVSNFSPSENYNSFNAAMLGTMQETEDGFEPTFTESLRTALDPLIYLVSQTAFVLTGSYLVFLRQDL
ncbi:MAG: ABC transporter permease [Candidatus Nanohaloarchaea archaeon]